MALSPPLNSDRRIGPYLLQSVIGEGGMGTVYRAEQLEPVRRTVALKMSRDAIVSAEVIRVDLLLLDVMMPEKSGYDVCKEIRAHNPAIPILMLTAKGEEIDKVVGLKLGADDYVTKPFGVHELLARIDALFRRAGLSQSAPVDDTAQFHFGSGRVSPKRFTLERGGKPGSLSQRELTLIQTFAAHPNEVLTRDQLLNAGWGIDYLGTTRTLDQHIANLRKKIEHNPARPQTITTVHGIGYRYETAE